MLKYLVALFLALPSLAWACGPGRGEAEFVRNLLDRTPENDRVLETHLGQDARNVINAFNASPPVSEFVGDKVLILGPGDTLNEILLIVSDGCVVTGVVLPREVIDIWLGSPA